MKPKLLNRVIWPLLLAALAFATLANAETCCIGQLCQDVNPTQCSNQNGIPGYCNVGMSCGATACDATGIVPIAGFVAHKAPGGADVRFDWQADGFADSYNVWFVTSKSFVPAGLGDGTISLTVPTATVNQAVHAGSVPGPTGEIFFYEVVGYCGGSSAATGACCAPTGCIEDVTRADCAVLGGIYGGDSEKCTPNLCRLGACCDQLDATCTDDTIRTACQDAGGAFQGSGSDCASVTCTGACCEDSGRCVENETLGSCSGVFQGIGSTCTGLDCSGACCDPVFGTCTDGTIKQDCRATGGVWQGPLTDCVIVDCSLPVGACCDPTTKVCTDAQTQPQCDLNGGLYQGDGTDCATINCP